MRDTTATGLAAGALAVGLLAVGHAQASDAAVAAKSPPPTCRLRVPAGQQMRSGIVTLKGTNRSGLFEGFQLVANGVRYAVVTNFYDGRRPLTRVVNLACKQAPVQFIQVANVVRVVGRAGGTNSRPVLRATVVQVLTFKDRGA
ncbi:MAG: hypothetical protein ACXVRJ_14630 [Gaiellaceae bacterium]